MTRDGGFVTVDPEGLPERSPLPTAQALLPSAGGLRTARVPSRSTSCPMITDAEQFIFAPPIQRISVAPALRLDTFRIGRVGKLKPKARPPPLGALDVNFFAVRVDDLLHDTEA